MVVTDRNEYWLEQERILCFTLKIGLETGSLGLLSSSAEVLHFELLHPQCVVSVSSVP